jgi:phage terminase small subunit
VALKPKQTEFVRQYLVDLNATQAAIRAGYSPKTANEQGARMLAKVSIQEAIADAMKARAERTELTADEVVFGLRREANHYGPNSLHTARVKAWELLGKHIRMFPDQHEHFGPGGGPIPVSHSMDLTRLSDDDLRQLDRILDRAGPALPATPDAGGSPGGNGQAVPR